jgi:opacity protein-like surface antigen
MKNLLLIAIIATSFSGLANANNGVYASLKAGISETKLKDNNVNYFYDDGEYYSHEDYGQANLSKTIYPSIYAAVGFDFSKISNVDARAELEYAYKDKTNFTSTLSSEVWTNSEGSESFSELLGVKFFSNNLRTQSLMLNGYYDFKNISKFTPYISAGVGFTHIKNDYINKIYPEYRFSKTDNQFTWSAGVGIAYSITDNVSLNASYRYIDAGNFKFDEDFYEYSNEKTSFKLSSQDYSLGIRYNF